MIRIFVLIGIVGGLAVAYLTTLGVGPITQRPPSESLLTAFRAEGFVPASASLEIDESAEEAEVFGIPAMDEMMLEQARANMADMPGMNMDGMAMGDADSGDMPMTNADGSTMDMSSSDSSMDMATDNSDDATMPMTNADGSTMDMATNSTDGSAMPMTNADGSTMDMATDSTDGSAMPMTNADGSTMDMSGTDSTMDMTGDDATMDMAGNEGTTAGGSDTMTMTNDGGSTMDMSGDSGTMDMAGNDTSMDMNMDMGEGGLLVTEDGDFDREYALEMSEWKFSDMQIDVKVGERIKFTIKNSGQIPHEFMFMDMPLMQAVAYRTSRADWSLVEHEALFERALVLPGGEFTFVLKVTQAGSWMFMCMLPYHMQMGMMGQMATEGMAMDM